MFFSFTDVFYGIVELKRVRLIVDECVSFLIIF